VIAELAEQAGYTVWSSGDGKELIVGQPDYAQAVQYRFRLAASTDPRGSSNVLNITTENSTDDRYSMITVLGHGAGTDGNYGTGPADRAGAVKNNARTPFGDGLDFSAPKRLTISERDDVRSRADALRRATTEMRKRDLRKHVITVEVDHHGQLVAGSARTLYACDTLAEIEDNEQDLRGTYLVVSVQYTASRDGGEKTVLELLPKGTVLVP
jgi:prophage tail gpP-like protein